MATTRLTLNPQKIKVPANGSFSEDVSIPSDKAFYLGDSGTDGSWRITRSGDNLVFQQREGGAWVTKSTMNG